MFGAAGVNAYTGLTAISNDAPTAPPDPADMSAGPPIRRSSDNIQSTSPNNSLSL